MTSELRVPILDKTGKYLGIPSNWGSSKRDMFAWIQTRVNAKLAGWKEQLISKGGKEVLLKSGSRPSWGWRSLLMGRDSILPKLTVAGYINSEQNEWNIQLLNHTFEERLLKYVSSSGLLVTMLYLQSIICSVAASPLIRFAFSEKMFFLFLRNMHLKRYDPKYCLMIGTAFALNILFHIPVWAGVLLTDCSTLVLLGLRRYGIRKLEMLIATFVFVMAACFFGQLGHVKPPASKVLKGMLIPNLSGSNAVRDTISLLGALVMPHNLFLHSALVLSRKVPRSVRGVNDACRFFLIESGFALFVAFLINVSVMSVSGTICSDVLRRYSSMIYAIALLASGQGSSITGTYAGQYIILIVSTISGSSGAGRLIIIASMILWFELPFALIPLLRFSSSATKMGPYKNSIYIIVISWILEEGFIAINVYYLSTGKDTIVTFTHDPVKHATSTAISGDQLPYQEDLADIRFPE
ncbi:hypothetical protein ACJRO7_026122 [Eucalyptus globulus]|uniref:Uncharacterized protein n=1 Tax=Eucalyptus globulus TaxID=34317 RepID=A0ABD3KD90_EUCGL